MLICPDDNNSNSSNTVNNSAHIAETPENIVINSQAYDKVSFEPKPFTFINISTLRNVLSQMINITPGTTVYSQNSHKYDQRFLIRDNQNVSKYYLIFRHDKYSIINVMQNDVCIQSVSLYDENSRKVAYYISSGNGYITQYDTVAIETDVQYLCQNDTYLFFKVLKYHTSHSSSYQYGILKFNKNDYRFSICYFDDLLSNVSSNPQENSIYYLKHDENFIYLFLFKFKEAITSHTTQNRYIVKYNVNTDTKSVLSEYQTDSNFPINRCAPLKISDNLWYMICTYSTRSNQSNSLILKIALNGDNVSWNSNLISANIINPNTGNDYDAYSMYKTVNNDFIILKHHIENNSVYDNEVNKDYLALCSGNTSSNGYNVFHTIHSSIMLPGKCYGCIQYSSDIFICFCSECIIFYQISSNQIIKKYEKSGTYHVLGMDEQKRIYIIKDETIDIIHDLTAVTLEAKFTDSDTEYTGTNIESSVQFFAKNFINNYINVPVELSLSGPVEFQDGSIKKELTTEEDINSIPVVITGAGNISITIKQK